MTHDNKMLKNEREGELARYDEDTERRRQRYLDDQLLEFLFSPLFADVMRIIIDTWDTTTSRYIRRVDPYLRVRIQLRDHIEENAMSIGIGRIVYRLPSTEKGLSSLYQPTPAEIQRFINNGKRTSFLWRYETVCFYGRDEFHGDNYDEPLVYAQLTYKNEIPVVNVEPRSEQIAVPGYSPQEIYQLMLQKREECKRMVSQYRV